MVIDKNIIIPWSGWELVEQIGRGQFGTVYKIACTKYGITEYAAMKVISIPNDPQQIQLDYSYGYDKESVIAKYRDCRDDVLTEYQLMMKVKGNSNIVRCDDISVIPHEDSIGYDIYIRMEFLTPILRVITDIDNEESIIKLGMDICKALVSCEKADILHRDIKPSNILINEQGDFKLGDFGVSRTLENENTYGTKGIGTYDYMAPEIYNGERYGKEADIYSLGMVLYWLLNSRTLPFLTKGKAPTVQEITSARQKRFSGANLPSPLYGNESLISVVLNACSYDPKARYKNAQDMLNDLISIQYGKEVTPTAAQINNQERITEKQAVYQQQDRASCTWNDTQGTVGKSYSQPSWTTNAWSESQATVGRNYTPGNANSIQRSTISRGCNTEKNTSVNTKIIEENGSVHGKLKKPFICMWLGIASIVFFFGYSLICRITSSDASFFVFLFGITIAIASLILCAQCKKAGVRDGFSKAGKATSIIGLLLSLTGFLVFGSQILIEQALASPTETTTFTVEATTEVTTEETITEAVPETTIVDLADAFLVKDIIGTVDENLYDSYIGGVRYRISGDEYFGDREEEQSNYYDSVDLNDTLGNSGLVVGQPILWPDGKEIVIEYYFDYNSISLFAYDYVEDQFYSFSSMFNEYEFVVHSQRIQYYKIGNNDYLGCVFEVEKDGNTYSYAWVYNLHDNGLVTRVYIFVYDETDIEVVLKNISFY